MIVRLPGVYPPQHDTSLLSDALLFEPLTADSRVLDLCCGTGALSVAARRAGAGHVVAVDISRRAQVNTWLNAVVNRKRVDARRGDLTDAVGSELFDLIISNPPYVPAWDDALPTAGIARAWDAGKDGRSVLDRIAASAPDHVAPGGTAAVAPVRALWSRQNRGDTGGIRDACRSVGACVGSVRPGDDWAPDDAGIAREIGRASCRERV